MGIKDRLETLSRGELIGLITVVAVTLAGAGLWYARSLPKTVEIAAAGSPVPAQGVTGAVSPTAASPSGAPIIVDVTDGKISKGPAGERRLATSVDGSVIAASAGAGAPVVVRSTKGWLADDGTSIGSVEVPDGFTEAVSIALDAKGDRLAIVWRAEDGTARADVHDGTDGWRRVWSEPVAGTAAAAVAWLR